MNITLYAGGALVHVLVFTGMYWHVHIFYFMCFMNVSMLVHMSVYIYVCVCVTKMGARIN